MYIQKHPLLILVSKGCLYTVVENGNWCVYCHTNKINGKKYVGITSRKPEKRWGYNGYSYKPYRTGISHFWNAIQKYGWENFNHEIIATNLTKEEANNFEKLLIAKLDTRNPENGYNKTEGGEGASGIQLSEKTRIKMSESHKGMLFTEEHKKRIVEANRGKVRSEECVKQMSKRNKGKKLTDEHKKKISEAHKGEKHWNYGKHHSEETRKKISDKQTKIPVNCYTKELELIAEYESISEASRLSGVDGGTISKCCKHKPHYNTAGGFVWCYASEIEEKGVDVA